MGDLAGRNPLAYRKMKTVVGASQGAYGRSHLTNQAVPLRVLNDAAGPTEMHQRMEFSEES